ncbi:MAG TPA: ABC transporter permease subunit [Candidatus Limnocylindrales bacterium]|nr:ABC transporter permease subunit [Candidatus Limnocylindrales bacterium]
MTGALLGLEARRSRTLTFWLAIVAIIYGALVAALYPTMKANAKLLEDYLNILPKGFLAAFGMMGGSLVDPGNFFATYIGIFLWPILAALGGILLASRPVAADLERGFLELPLSTRASRSRYLGLTIAVHAIAIGVLASATVGGFLVVGWLVGAGFDNGRLLLVVVPAAAFGLAIHGATSALSVATLSRGLAGGLVGGVLLGMYLLDIVARLQPDFEWVGAASAFRYFDVRTLINTGVLDVGGTLLFLAVALGGWAIAIWRFRTRDLVA